MGLEEGGGKKITKNEPGSNRLRVEALEAKKSQKMNQAQTGYQAVHQQPNVKANIK